MENSKTNHIVNADQIFINNRNDLHSQHIDILTKGGVGDNDLQLTNMNVNVTSGGSLTAPNFKTTIIKDISSNNFLTFSNGNTLDFNCSNIDFNNATLTNMASISASQVGSANGFSSLDAELDSLQTNKVNITGHTASKVFVSTNGGGLTTSSITTTDLDKLQYLSISQNVNLDTIESTANSALQNFNTMKSTTIEVGGGANKAGNVDFKMIGTAMNINPDDWKYLILRTPTLSADHIVVLPSSAGTLQLVNGSGNIITDTERTKLNGIEASATADQTDAEIRTAVEAASDSNVFTDANHSKLDGIEAGANITDAANVRAAGALMDDEMTDLAGVKALTVSNYSTAAQVAASLVSLIQTYGLTLTGGGAFDGDAVNTLTNTNATKLTDVAYASGGQGTTTISNVVVAESEDAVWRLETTRSSNTFIQWASSGASGTDWDFRYGIQGVSERRLWFFTSGHQKFYVDSNTESMVLFNDGQIRFGDGGNPTGNAHISVYSANTGWGDTRSGRYISNSSSAVQYDSNTSTDAISIYANRAIFANTYLMASDKRIKNNIVPVPDNLSLDIVRKLECVYYNYIDRRRSDKTIGWLAQDVKEHFPVAVSIQKEVIPNEMRDLNNPEWESLNDGKYSLTTDIEDVSGSFYKFVLLDENEKEIEKIMVMGDDKKFTFDKKYSKVFIYGKRVDDFLTIDKGKIQALAYSALQEIDKIQQKHIIDIASIKLELQKEINKTKYFEDKLRDIEDTLKSLTK